MVDSYDGLFFLIVTFIMLFLSVEYHWTSYEYEKSTNRDNQITMRGVFVIVIIVSHMFRNNTSYTDLFSTSVLHFFFPSIVCIFFYYSGYGLMCNFLNKKEQATVIGHITKYFKKLVIPAMIVYLLCIIVAIFTKEQLPAITSIGGWFGQVLLLLYISYIVISCFTNIPKELIALETIFIAIFTVIIKLLGGSSFLFIDLPAFVFGMLVKAEEKRFKNLFKRKWIFISCIVLTLIGGGYLAMARYGAAPTGLGLGLILGFINSISEVIVIQILLTHIYFRKRNLLHVLGTYSYEIYLAGALAKPLALLVCVNRIGYYFMYVILCIIVGVLISKTCNFLLHIGKQ